MADEAATTFQLSHPSSLVDPRSRAVPQITNSKPAPLVAPEVQNVVSTVTMGCQLAPVVQNVVSTVTMGCQLAPVVQNVVSTVTMGCQLDLRDVALRGRNTEHNPKFARMIQQLGYDVKVKDFKVQNMVASCDVGFRINLDVLSVAYTRFCDYNPEIFPALTYKVVEPKVTLLIFANGKINFAGAKGFLVLNGLKAHSPQERGYVANAIDSSFDRALQYM